MHGEAQAREHCPGCVCGTQVVGMHGEAQTREHCPEYVEVCVWNTSSQHAR